MIINERMSDSESERKRIIRPTNKPPMAQIAYATAPPIFAHAHPQSRLHSTFRLCTATAMQNFNHASD